MMTMSKPVPAGSIRVTYCAKSLDFTLADLAALPHKTVTVDNEHTKADETYSGVPLMELLLKVGAPEKPMGKDCGVLPGGGGVGWIQGGVFGWRR